MKQKKLFTATLAIVLLINTHTWAQIPAFVAQQGGYSGGAEFFAGKLEGKPLIKINVTSGLRFSGVYHIPIDTNLAELISFGGGAVTGADMSEIAVVSEGKERKSEYKEYDFYSITKSNDRMPVLKNGDVVNIPVSGDNLARTALWIGLLATVTSVTISVMAYQNSR